MPIYGTPPVEIDRFPKWQSGLWYDIRQGFGGTGTAVLLVANTLYASPLWVPRAGNRIDRIGINITAAAAAGKLARLMIYRSTADGLPGALLLDAGTVAADAIATPTITIDLVLPQGVLFTAIVSDGAPTISSVHSTAMSYGSNAIGGVLRASPNRSFTFGAAPDPFGTLAGFFADNFVRVGVRAV